MVEKENMFSPTKVPPRQAEYGDLPVFGLPKDLPQKQDPTEFWNSEFENSEFENSEFENLELKIEKWKGFFSGWGLVRKLFRDLIM